mmetsp:Transcript_101589/g.176638  ORF Transcript_101589/g.176638 Transcript_101589/m.176638 type:complete len:88 (+) Transcript_101589:493-756(+)
MLAELLQFLQQDVLAPLLVHGRAVALLTSVLCKHWMVSHPPPKACEHQASYHSSTHEAKATHEFRLASFNNQLSVTCSSFLSSRKLS